MKSRFVENCSRVHGCDRWMPHTDRQTVRASVTSVAIANFADAFADA